MPTFTLIQPAVVVGSGGAATISFTSIPATYTDLAIVMSLRLSTGSGFSPISFNGSTSNFTARTILGAGSGTPTSGSRTDSIIQGVNNPSTSTASTFSSVSIYIPNYAGSTNKSFSIDTLWENNATAAEALLFAGLWSQTAAINSFGITASSGTFVEHSTAYLYGVSNA